MIKKLLLTALLCLVLIAGWQFGLLHKQLIETKLELTQTYNKIAQLHYESEVKDNDLLLLRAHLVAERKELRNTQLALEKATNPLTPRHFKSFEELENWLIKDDTDQMQYSKDTFNCISFALQLQERALADGYIISTEVLPVAYHWVNIAVIGDMYYVIEPQDDRIILKKGIK